MRQQELIDAVRGSLDGDERVGALFLSGSYGKGAEDAFSDVDFLLVTEGEHRDAVVEDFLKAAESVLPLISSNRMDFGSLMVHSILEDWTRFDVIAGDSRVLGGKTRDGLKPLIDPSNLWSGLPETAEWQGPDPNRVQALVKEFTRVLGLTAVGHGRKDWATLAMGCGLLRGNLVALMTLAVPMPDTGGILHNRKIFAPEHYQALLELPPAGADWDSVRDFTRACAGGFYPLARELAVASGAEWPERFIEATRAHLIDTLGIDLMGN